jgi:RNA-binding protein
LYRLGSVLHKSRGSNNLILRAENTAFPGEVVVDKSLKKVGAVLDLFGPINTPYISVRPFKSNPDEYVGQILYKEAPENRRRGRVWQKR